jgi:hypothetical protein
MNFALPKNLIMKQLFKTFLFSGILFFLVGCDQNQRTIDNITSELSHAEQNLSSLNEQDWNALEKKMDDLDKSLTDERSGFSQKQIEDARKLQGKYAALILKREVGGAIDGIKDLGNQVEGFIEAIQDSTN